MWAIERSPHNLVNSNDLLRPHTPSWNESNCDQCEKNKIKKRQLWKTHDNKTYIVQKIMKNMRNLLTIFFVLTPLPEMKKMWSMRKRNYKNDNFEKHMIIKHELSKRLYRIWETFYDVAGQQWPEKILSKLLGIVNQVKCWKVVTWSRVLLLFLLVRCHPTWHLLSQDNR